MTKINEVAESPILSKTKLTVEERDTLLKADVHPSLRVLACLMTGQPYHGKSIGELASCSNAMVSVVFSILRKTQIGEKHFTDIIDSDGATRCKIYQLDVNGDYTLNELYTTVVIMTKKYNKDHTDKYKGKYKKGASGMTKNKRRMGLKKELQQMCSVLYVMTQGIDSEEFITLSDMVEFPGAELSHGKSRGVLQHMIDVDVEERYIKVDKSKKPYRYAWNNSNIPDEVGNELWYLYDNGVYKYTKEPNIIPDNKEINGLKKRLGEAHKKIGGLEYKLEHMQADESRTVGITEENKKLKYMLENTNAAIKRMTGQYKETCAKLKDANTIIEKQEEQKLSLELRGELTISDIIADCLLNKRRLTIRLS